MLLLDQQMLRGMLVLWGHQMLRLMMKLLLQALLILEGLVNCRSHLADDGHPDMMRQIQALLEEKSAGRLPLLIISTLAGIQEGRSRGAAHCSCLGVIESPHLLNYGMEGCAGVIFWLLPLLPTGCSGRWPGDILGVSQQGGGQHLDIFFPG